MLSWMARDIHMHPLPELARLLEQLGGVLQPTGGQRRGLAFRKQSLGVWGGAAYPRVLHAPLQIEVSLQLSAIRQNQPGPIR